MKPSALRSVLVVGFVFVGFFGAAFAVSGILVPLPAPAAGGTCGPGAASESALSALTDPSSIGAGPEPSAANTAAHAQWSAFVDQCQSAADQRGFATAAILALSVAVGIGVPLLLLRRRTGSGTDGLARFGHGGSVPGPPPSAPPWDATHLVG